MQEEAFEGTKAQRQGEFDGPLFTHCLEWYRVPTNFACSQSGYHPSIGRCRKNDNHPEEI